jgi:signal transduction histidine kinase
LDQLIEELLTISRLQSNQIIFNIEEADIIPLLKDLAEDYMPIALQRNLRFEFLQSSKLPLALVDLRLLTQVVSNILIITPNYIQLNGLIKLTTGMEQADGKRWVSEPEFGSTFTIWVPAIPEVSDSFSARGETYV